MDEPEQQRNERALPAWANQYEARKRNDPDASTYEEYDDMDLWDEDEPVAPAPLNSLPPAQDYLAMIQQTRREMEQAQKKQKEQHEKQLQQQRQLEQQMAQRPVAGSGRGRGRGRGAGWQAGRPAQGATAAPRQGEASRRDADADLMDLSEVNVIEKEKKPRKPVPKLDAEKLLGEQGLPLLRKYGQTFRVRRKYASDSEKRANAKDNLARMMAMCQTWGDNLFPKATFHDFIRLAEAKCKNDDRVKITMSTWRDEHFDQERLKREALEEQHEKEAQLATAAATGALDDEMDLAAIFSATGHGGSSSPLVAHEENGLSSSVSSPSRPLAAPRTPIKPTVAASRPSEKSRPQIELDDDDDDSDDGFLQTTYNDDAASTLSRIRQQRAARLAAMRSEQEPSIPTAGDDLTQELATTPPGDDSEDTKKLDKRYDDSMDETTTIDRSMEEGPEETMEASSQRRRRRLIVDESDDDE
ncbi:chromosome segregation in meiosis- protein [Actinomortierella ambigua]|nr:chromosome segregation in meiosis- protein [Actinomortierella ambigua]